VVYFYAATATTNVRGKAPFFELKLNLTAVAATK
jgi:hypothetical protein